MMISLESMGEPEPGVIASLPHLSPQLHLSTAHYQIQGDFC